MALELLRRELDLIITDSWRVMQIIRIATWRQTNDCVLGSANEGRTGAYLGGGIVRASFIPRTASSSSSFVNRVMGSRCVRWWYASGLDGHSALAELLDCGSMV